MISLLGIPVTAIAEADEIFSKTKPDICLVQTGANIPDVMPHLKLCAKHGVNVLTLAERLYDPWYVFRHVQQAFTLLKLKI